MISVILPTYCPNIDVEQKLAECLQALVLYTPSDAEFVIIEQGVPACAQHLPALTQNNRRVVYESNAKPMGYAKAVNRGVAMASGTHYLIVNNDILVGRDWATKLVGKYDEYVRHPNPKFAMISASDSPEPETDVLEFPVSWWSCVCIGEDAWNAIGGLDDELLNYRMHDQDWSIRAWQRGFCVGRYHGVKVKHDESSTYRLMKIDEAAERAEMHRRYGVEHFFEYIAKSPR